MKQLLLIPLLLHMSGGHLFKKASYPTVDLMPVRMEPWPINLQRVIYYTDTCYAFKFRDQSTMNAIAIKTMDLETMEQLKYFKDRLTTLKKVPHGHISEFRNSSIKK